MIEVAEMDTVGYATLDTELRFIGCSNAFTRILRTAREELLGKHISEVFGEAPFLETMLRNAAEHGLRSRFARQPHVFKSWPKWEEHSYDFSVYPLGARGDASMHILLRISLTAAAPEVEKITSLLRHSAGAEPLPLFSGEDSNGRAVDMYVHPAAAKFSDRLVLLSVYRDTHESTTFEVPASMLSRIVLAHLLHVQS